MHQTDENSVAILLVTLPLKTNLNRQTVVKQIGNKSYESIKQLTIKSEDSSSLETSLFNGFNFMNLVTLKIESGLKTLPEKCFSDLSNLNDLDLSNNQLESVHSSVFNELKGLETLNLYR